MYGDKEVSLCLVGNLCTSYEGYKYIGFARIDHFHIATVALNVFSEGECCAQVDVLLLREFSDSTHVMTTVSCINYERELAFAGCHCHSRTKKY